MSAGENENLAQSPEFAFTGFTFTKKQRLLNASDYSRVFNDAPVRASTPEILLLCAPNDLAHPRVGLIVAKKHIKNATQRNEFKRIARESFRLDQHKIPPIDAIVLARRGADKLTKQDLHKAFKNLWKRVAKKAEKLQKNAKNP